MTLKNEMTLKKKRIIVVENELIVSKNIENQLIKLGYEVVAIIDNGPDAVAKAAELSPDLVLMDIHLSGDMDGIEAAHQIGTKNQIPVVYLTAYADNNTIQRAKITTPYGYIIKPFDPDKLKSSIEIALYKHQIERKLKASELRFRTLADSSPVGIFQTNMNGQYTYVNKRWCEISGLLPQQALGDNWIEALHPEDRKSTFEYWTQMIQYNKKFTQEYRFKTPSGFINWVYCHTTPLSSELGEKVGYIGTVTDITQRKRLEDELLTAHKLESIGILAGGIAHDFNNLLSIILGNISILLGEANITRDQIDMIKNAENACIQAADLARKLITFSKGGWLDRKKISIDELFIEVTKGEFSQWEDFFKIDIPEHLWPVNGDKNKLKQVFSNIITNALEASENRKAKSISITAENISVDTTEELSLKPGRYIKISFTDQGSGITKEDIEKIFDPYFTTKLRGARRGQGLGLTICYSIVQKHEGHIQVASKPQKGTTVSVFLPAYPDVSQFPIQ